MLFSVGLLVFINTKTLTNKIYNFDQIMLIVSTQITPLYQAQM